MQKVKNPILIRMTRKKEEEKIKEKGRSGFILLINP